MVKVLMVCTANICRSPMAQGLLRHLVTQAGLEREIVTDSAGLTAYHIGRPPDGRARKIMRQRGIEIDDLRARLITRDDLAEFDHLLAMDGSHLRFLEHYLDTPGRRAKAQLITAFSHRFPYCEVADPYHGNAEAFGNALTMLEDANHGLLAYLCERYRL